MSGGWVGASGFKLLRKRSSHHFELAALIEMKTCFSTAPCSDQSAESLSELSLSGHDDLFLIVFKAALSVPTLHV